MGEVWISTPEKKNVYLYLGSGSLHPIFGKVVGILVAGGHICVEVRECDTMF